MDGKIVRRHQDQIRKRTDDSSGPSVSYEAEVDDSVRPVEGTVIATSGGAGEQTLAGRTLLSPSSESQTQTDTTVETQETRRYPSRTRQPPARFAETDL